jgi:hypothetical protein
MSSLVRTPFRDAWREHVATPPRTAQLYADAERLRVSLKRFNDASWPYLGEAARWLDPLTEGVPETLQGLASELCRERHHGVLFASPITIAPDSQWVKRLDELEGGNPRIQDVMTLLRDLYPPASKLLDECQQFLEEGCARNLPLPLLSAVKTTIAFLDSFVSGAPIEQEVARLRNECQTVGKVAQMLDLPAASRLTAAAKALEEKA